MVFQPILIKMGISTMNLCGPFSDPNSFLKWFVGVSSLRVFCAKPVKLLEVISRNPILLKVLWKRSRKDLGAIVGVCFENPSDYIDIIYKMAMKNSLQGIVFTSNILEMGYDGWGKVWVYNVDSVFLKANLSVEIKIIRPEKTNMDVLADVEKVQRSSWGFYVRPLKGDYIILAYLGGAPVGSAYYNPRSSNIDYGIHVAREYWGKRIGTGLLVEITKLAKILGMAWISVMRVLRGRKPTLPDRRAIGFYRANNPCLEINIYRIPTNRKI